jgi:hypothetical protein
MASKPKKSSKRATTTRSSKKVVLVRPPLDFTKPLEEQKEALEEFVDSFAEELMKPTDHRRHQHRAHHSSGPPMPRSG